MALAAKVFRNLYRDSVTLMQISADVAREAVVDQAWAVMATDANIALLKESGLAKDIPPEAGPNDLLFLITGADQDAVDSGLADAEKRLTAKHAGSGGEAEKLPSSSIQMALEDDAPQANLVLVSTPGEYAGAEAMKALKLGLNVMIFSDNVPVEDEVRLKTYAKDHDLLVMGPDCGTAIIDGVPLAFANVVRRGPVGIVAASGTGLQQVSCLLDRAGVGVSQAIGTGGRDLKEDVGGLTMLAALDHLAKDKDTEVIVLISKPPADSVAKKVLAAAEKAGKPVVVNFLGADEKAVTGKNLKAARTLEDAANAAIKLSGKDIGADPPGKTRPPKFKASQKYIRALYTGGTFSSEAALMLHEAIGGVYSNVAVDPKYAIEDVWKSTEHTVIDLGDDDFTRGRPHPMIDPTLRNERIINEAKDPGTAVILLDFVLGYGAHDDPAGDVASVITEARKIAKKDGRTLAFVGFICGTEGDPQNLAAQEKTLKDAGVLLAPSNARAVRLAAALIGKEVS